MSIDRMFDDYLEVTGLSRGAEVVPDHACQVFEVEVPQGPVESSGIQDSLGHARDTVEKILRAEI